MARSSLNWRRLALLVAGWFFLVLGVLGLFLPVLQGILFLFVGVAFLSLASPRVRLLRMRLGNRYPKLREGEERARVRLKRQFRRFGKDRSPDGGPAAPAK